MRRVSLLGSTGSIGTQTLEVIGERRDEFEVVALAAGGGNPRLLAEQASDFDVPLVAVARDDQAAAVEKQLRNVGAAAEVRVGDLAVIAAAEADCDVVVNAITGAAGLRATMATLASDRTLALANKESLVIGGDLVINAAREGQLVAVDSEHSAFAQCLRAGRSEEVRRFILTASGGPFRGWERGHMATATVEQAMAHPTWNMGNVITINSATLVNKGLELIEAALLYGVDYDDIHVVVHPQSVVHSAVEFIDGSTIAQCSPPSMKLPISMALDWPRRLANAAAPCDWTRPTAWTFEPLDNEAFPAVELARRVGKAGGTAPAVYNAANEACVAAFVRGEIRFNDITDTVATVVDHHLRNRQPPMTLASVLDADSWARGHASELLRGLEPPSF